MTNCQLKQTTAALVGLSLTVLLGCSQSVAPGPRPGSSAPGSSAPGSSTVGETTAGETTAGETTAGETTGGSTLTEQAPAGGEPETQVTNVWVGSRPSRTSRDPAPLQVDLFHGGYVEDRRGDFMFQVDYQVRRGTLPSDGQFNLLVGMRVEGLTYVFHFNNLEIRPRGNLRMPLERPDVVSHGEVERVEAYLEYVDPQSGRMPVSARVVLASYRVLPKPNYDIELPDLVAAERQKAQLTNALFKLGGLFAGNGEPKPLGEKELEVLRQQLTGGDVPSTQKALRRLAEIKEPQQRSVELTAEITAHLTSDSGFLRNDAATALEFWGTEDAVPDLIGALADKSFVVRHAAIRGLGRIGGRDAAEAVVQVYEHEASLVDHVLNLMAERIRASGDSEPSPDEPTYVEQAVWPLLQTERPRVVRIRACRLLARTGTRASIAKLKPLRTDPDEQIQVDAEHAITRLAAAHPTDSPSKRGTPDKPDSPDKRGTP